MTRHSDDDPDRDRAGGAEEPGEGADRLDPSEVDERFAELIADLKDDTPGWPEDEPKSDEPARRAHPSSGDDDEPSLLELWDTELEDDDDDEEEDTYRPPPPPPLPVPSLPAILGVLLIIGGLVLIVQPSLLDVGEGLGRTTGIAAFGGGVLMLIWRLRPEPEDGEDDDPGNGAVV
ncbi:DUF308 domain-containing protein [Stackebrandtia nassauensis]|uniref:DUF308 domain-containing protein n=1 Tax=Stackebrandtia nassauensis (strain DSM 44728 / CIP 108903 / NRRL B-16338 / NBRC 102104 / LLR-40K-21) TaxID=446470 RepID=D3Q9N3_STANL|nr:DUF308 domain-containing protein [Stackebrandtia nassauensis]ADD44579.1 hypothetical protein Snas_4938 [Stackebrandtia nassauensis DSM 44728]